MWWSDNLQCVDEAGTVWGETSSHTDGVHDVSTMVVDLRNALEAELQKTTEKPRLIFRQHRLSSVDMRLSAIPDNC